MTQLKVLPDQEGGPVGDGEPDPRLAQLEALRAERARIAAAREAAEQRRALDDEIEAESRALEDEKALAAAEEAYGPVGRKIATVQTDCGIVIVKKPNHLHFKRFQDSSDTSSATVMQLVKPCVVYPDKIEFDRYMVECPGALTTIANRVCELAGIRAKEVAGK